MHNPFFVMCEMWGIEMALKKAKEFGIKVPQEDIDAQIQKEKRKQNAWNDMISSCERGKEE